MADSNKPEWFSLSGNYFEETAIALGNSGYKDVKITLSDEPDRPEYHLHKVILAASSSFFRSLFFYDPKEAYDIGAVSKLQFDAVIDFIYGQHLILTEHNYDDIWEAVLYLGCEKMKTLMKWKWEDGNLELDLEYLVRFDHELAIIRFGRIFFLRNDEHLTLLKLSALPNDNFSNDELWQLILCDPDEKGRGAYLRMRYSLV